MFNLLDDDDLERLALATFQIEPKDESEQDSRGWNKCLAAIWKSYLEIKEAEC